MLKLISCKIFLQVNVQVCLENPLVGLLQISETPERFSTFSPPLDVSVWWPAAAVVVRCNILHTLTVNHTGEVVCGGAWHLTPPFFLAVTLCSHAHANPHIHLLPSPPP